MVDNFQHVGDFKFDCAICGQPICVPIHAGFKIREGKSFVTTDTDTSAIWMHLWTDHPEYASEASDLD